MALAAITGLKAGKLGGREASIRISSFSKPSSLLVFQRGEGAGFL
jgi:hypothetical protein